MAVIRRSRLGLLAVLVASAVVTALLALPATSQAFYVQNHERITRDALAPVGVDNTAMTQILVGPPPGAGVVGSDAFFFDEFRHIDDAKNPADICALTEEAWNFFTPIVLTGAQPPAPMGAISSTEHRPALRSAAWLTHYRISTPTPTGWRTTSPWASWIDWRPR